MSNPSSDSDPLASPTPPPPPEAPDDEPSAVWYYAVRDQRHGPVTLEEIRQMLSRGDLAEDDLVWRAGMSDWAPAMEVDGLFDASGSPPIDIDSEVPPGGPPPSLRAKEKLREAGAAATATARAWTHWLHDHVETRTWVLAGLLLVLLARGCDSVAEHNVQRQAAIATLAPAEWDAAHNRELAERNLEIEALETRGGKRADLVALKKSLADFEKQRTETRRELQTGKWQELSDDAKLAARRYEIHAYWRQWMVLWGAAILTISLGAVAISDRTPDRWVAMMMLGIILWSLLIGGVW